MTEPIGNRPGGVGVASPPTEVLPAFEDETSSGDNRRKLILVGAGVAVLIVAAALFFFTKGSGTAAAPTGPVPAGSPAAAKAAGGSSAPTQPTSRSTLPKVEHRPVGRNPFGALFAAGAVSTTTGTTGGAVTSNPDTPGSPATSVSVPPVPGPSPTTPSGNGGNPGHNPGPVSAPAPVWIKLDKIQALRSATFTVGYSNGTTRFFAQVPKETTQDPGTFAQFFQLQSVQGHYVTVKYGDGTAFDLHAGFRHRHLIH